MNITPFDRARKLVWQTEIQRDRHRDGGRNKEGEEGRARRGGDHAYLINLRLFPSENAACNAAIRVVSTSVEKFTLR